MVVLWVDHLDVGKVVRRDWWLAVSMVWNLVVMKDNHLVDYLVANLVGWWVEWRDELSVDD
jgi:hypothetical protein